MSNENREKMRTAEMFLNDSHPPLDKFTQTDWIALAALALDQASSSKTDEINKLVLSIEALLGIEPECAGCGGWGLVTVGNGPNERDVECPDCHEMLEDEHGRPLHYVKKETSE